MGGQPRVEIAKRLAHQVRLEESPRGHVHAQRADGGVFDLVERPGLVGQVNGRRPGQRQCGFVVGGQATCDRQRQRDRRVMPAAQAGQRSGPARHLNIVCDPLGDR